MREGNGCQLKLRKGSETERRTMTRTKVTQVRNKIVEPSVQKNQAQILRFYTNKFPPLAKETKRMLNLSILIRSSSIFWFEICLQYLCFGVANMLCDWSVRKMSYTI
jgi:hypothetical protein